MITECPELPLTPFRESFAQSLLNSAEMFACRPALWVDDQLYSYSKLATQALAIAATLQALELKPESCAIFAYRSAAAYQGIWGGLLAGFCYVPINPRFPVAKNKTILQAADCSVMIVDQRSEEAAHELLLTTDKHITVILPEHRQLPDWCQETSHHYLCQGEMMSADAWEMPERVNRYAYLLFTSGTTGQPKGIAVTHQNIRAYVGNVLKDHTLTANDRFSQMSDLTFDLSVHDMGCAWSVGGSLYVTPESALICPAEFVKRHELTCWNSVPSLLGFMNKFGKMKPGAFPHLRYSFFCGEAMPTAMADKWSQATPNGKVINLYGPTEATVAVTLFKYLCERPELPNLPIGKPLENQEIQIVDDQGDPVSNGDKGELWLGGSQVTDGYWQDNERTGQSFIKKTFSGSVAKRWYCTGDIVSWNEEYGLEFHGRKDFQVKVNGFRVELGEVEAVIRHEFTCDWVAVVPWPVDSAGAAKGLVAWLAGQEGCAQSVRQQCLKKLPPYMVPTSVFWQSELPRNANGKVDIRALQRLTKEKMRISK